MKARIVLSILILGLLLLVTAAIAYAQAGSVIPRWLIGGGGGQASSGSVSIISALGQPVGGVASSEASVICSGFWCGGPSVVSIRLYLPSILKELASFAPACSASNNDCGASDGSNKVERRR